MIEALIAMAIFSVGILALYTMQMTAIKGNSTANHIGIASAVLSDQIEILMNESYTAGDISPGNHTTAMSLPAGVQSCSWAVVDWSNDSADNDGDGDADELDEQNIKAINITVTYIDQACTKSITTKFFRINQ